MENPFETHMQNAEGHILLGFLWLHIWQNPRSNFCEKKFITNQNVGYKYKLTKILTWLELVSKELNHFGVIADLFRQIGGHTVPNNSYRFWADLLHKWPFLGYDWHP